MRPQDMSFMLFRLADVLFKYRHVN